MHITRRILDTALVITMALVTVARPAGARTTEELIADLGICYNRCSINSQGCNQSCCGFIFCKKRCIVDCNDSLNTCKATCDSQVFGGETSGAFFETATIARGGRAIRVGGPLSCVDGATADVDVTITQRSTGAVATGRVRQACAAGETAFTLDARVLRGTAFDTLGSAEACGAARIHPRTRRSLDAFQWCRTITLVPDGIGLED